MPTDREPSRPQPRVSTVDRSETRDDASDDDDTLPEFAAWMRRWGPVYALAALVVGASVVPVSAVGVVESSVAGTSPVSLTVGFHLGGYAALAVSLVRTRSSVRPDALVAVVAIGVAVGFGFGVELLQTFVPWRRFAWTDAAANTLGACVGVTVHAVLCAGSSSS